MKKLLNSPWGVAVLVLCAVFFGAKNFVSLGGGDTQDTYIEVEDDDSWEDIEEATAESQLIGVDELKHVEINNIVWKFDTPRDPFDIKQSDLATVLSSQEIPTTADTSGKPRLTALITGERSRLAVLDNHIVGVGDQVGPFLVKEFLPDGLLLSQRGRPVIVKLEE